jgi:hypothetical protein
MEDKKTGVLSNVTAISKSLVVVLFMMERNLPS